MCTLSNCSSDEQHPGIIYGLHNGDGRYRYIGYTTTKPALRLAQHRTLATAGSKSVKSKWMRKYGTKNIHGFD